MDKFFNTAGPNQPDIHYTLLPKDRVNWPDLSGLIGARKYFILHAPRQTGKTTVLLALMHYLNAQGKYRVLYANIENAQAARGDVGSGMTAISQVIARQAAYYLTDVTQSPLSRLRERGWGRGWLLPVE